MTRLRPHWQGIEQFLPLRAHATQNARLNGPLEFNLCAVRWDASKLIQKIDSRCAMKLSHNAKKTSPISRADDFIHVIEWALYSLKRLYMGKYLDWMAWRFNLKLIFLSWVDACYFFLFNTRLCRAWCCQWSHIKIKSSNMELNWGLFVN